MASDRHGYNREANTKRNLARLMTKSERDRQTVTNGRIGGKAMNHVVRKCSNVRDLIE